MAPSPAEENFTDELVGVDAYAAPRPQKKDFLPWHRPRKQYVREEQWLHEIKQLLSECTPEGNLLKYFGLPGIDLLDIRHFHSSLCEPNSMRMRFLGFNSGAKPKDDRESEFNISIDEVRRMSSIDAASDVLWDDFTSIAVPDSIAWKKTCDLGPYDVVNLDLCGGFAIHKPGELDDNHYNAINKLLALQARQKNSWILFLTARAGQSNIRPDVMDLLNLKYKKNLLECIPFQTRSKALFGVGSGSELDAALMSASGLLNVFLTGLGKWMLDLATNQNPPTRVSIRSVMSYQVLSSAPEDDMVSLALRFDPQFTPAADRVGIATSLGSAVDECALAVGIVDCVANRVRVDDLLRSNDHLFERMVSTKADLLEAARYNPTEYRAWVAQDRYTPDHLKT